MMRSPLYKVARSLSSTDTGRKQSPFTSFQKFIFSTTVKKKKKNKALSARMILEVRKGHRLQFSLCSSADLFRAPLNRKHHPSQTSLSSLPMMWSLQRKDMLSSELLHSACRCLLLQPGPFLSALLLDGIFILEIRNI